MRDTEQAMMRFRSAVNADGNLMIDEIEETGFGFVFKYDGFNDCIVAISESEEVFYLFSADMALEMAYWERYGEFVGGEHWKWFETVEALGAHLMEF